MSDDPARGRFFIIQAVRLGAVGCVVLGMLVAAQRIALPAWLGYLLLAMGLLGVFVIPVLLAKRWRTPE